KAYGNQDFWAVDSKVRLNLTENVKLTLDGDFSRKNDSEGNQWFLTSPEYSQATAAAILGQFGIQTAFPPGFYAHVGNWETQNSTPAAANLKDYGGSAKLEWSLPNVDITNIFAYRAQNTLYEQNYAHPITIDVPIVDNSKWYWYEELRAVS